MSRREPEHHGWRAAAARRRALGLLALAVAGCGGDRPETAVIDARPPIRLVDHAPEAEVSSPLLDAPSLADLLRDPERLGALKSWEADFAARESYTRHRCRLLEAGGIECERQGGERFSLAFELPVAAADTAFVAELRANRPECVMVQVWDDTERVRRPLPREATEWTRVPLLWRRRPDAKPAKLEFAPQRVAGACRLTLRSLTAYSLRPDPALRLASLTSRHAGWAGGAPGIVGFGSFLPLGEAETVEAPFDGNFGTREVLLAPAPTEIRFRVRLPRGARLGFSFALSQESSPGDRVDFEVRARSARGAERLLWSRRLELTRQSWHWHDATVALEELGGQTVDLVLATRSPDGAGLGIWGTPTIHTPRRTARPANVVLIGVDTLRADRLSAYGYGEPTSPRLDAFAGDGVLFRQAVAQSNWTLPSFASIFTGQIVARHRLTTFARRLAPGTVTLQGLFRAHGWRTHAVLYKASLYQRLDRGFETTFNVPRRYHRADQNLAKALDHLRRLRDQRFFLFVHFDDPHQPFTHPEEFRGAATEAGLRALGLEMPLDLPSEIDGCQGCLVEGRASAALKSLANRLYDEEIRYVDEQIGHLLDELRRLGLYDDAVIAFVSDHGETLWSHYDYMLHGSANLHDELIRVPLIVKPPAADGFVQGVVVESRVRAFDLMPTLLELAGLQVPPDLDARSLVPLLGAGGRAAAEPHRQAFSQGTSSAAFLVDRWKYLMPVGSGVPPTQGHQPALAGEELYDLESDPGELRDLADLDPGRLRAMRQGAIEHVIRAVGGSFLLVAGDTGEAMQRLRVVCAAGCSWDPLLQFGLEMESDDAGATSFMGPGLGEGVLLLARLSSAEPGELTVGLEPPAAGGWREVVAGVVDYEAGVVERLLESATPSAWLLTAPRRAGAEVEASTLDPQQERALRALGYLQ